jgi:hypothetical protein
MLSSFIAWGLLLNELQFISQVVYLRLFLHLSQSIFRPVSNRWYVIYTKAFTLSYNIITINFTVLLPEFGRHTIHVPFLSVPELVHHLSKMLQIIFVPLTGDSSECQVHLRHLIGLLQIKLSGNKRITLWWKNNTIAWSKRNSVHETATHTTPNDAFQYIGINLIHPPHI